jgi:hypothetical protein
MFGCQTTTIENCSKHSPIHNDRSTLRGDPPNDGALEQLMDLETAAVMKERMKVVTRISYDSKNVTFMLWLFDGRRYNFLLQEDLQNERSRHKG